MAKKVKKTISKSAKRGKKNHFCAIVIGLLVVISVVLAGLLYRLNVLPSGYIVIVVCALIVIVGLLSIGVLIKKITLTFEEKIGAVLLRTGESF